MRISLLCVLQVVLACGCLFGKDSWMKQLRPGHPRMFFNAEMWPAVKSRALGKERARFEALVTQVDKYPSNPVCSGFEPVEFGTVKTASGTHKITASTPIKNVKEWGAEAARCAFVWRITRKPEHLEKARRMIEVSVEAYLKAVENGRSVNWYSTTAVLALCAYDWIYEALDDSQRKALIVPLVQYVEAVQPGKGKKRLIRRNNGGISSGFYSVYNLLWFSGLAAYGDGYCDELALAHLKRGYELNQKLLQFRSDSAGDDGGLSSGVHGYCMGAYPWAHFNFMYTSISALGKNPAVDWPSMALFPNWIYWNWIPNPENARRPLSYGFGDDTHTNNALNVGALYDHMTQYMHFFKASSPEAVRLAASLRNLAPYKNLGNVWPMYPYLLGDVEEIVPYSKASLEEFELKARHFESLGQIVMRSGWRPDDTYCMFTAGAKLTQHKHLDDNNFVIYKKGFLALDSGSRGRETDYNLRHYYAQTVAHNCVLIHRPNEPLPSYWGVRYNGPEGKINHGGMYSSNSVVRAFQTNDHFTYVAGDASKNYGNKCTESVRQFIHIQPDYFVIYDRVGSSNAAYKKDWLLHVQNKPEITGKVLKTDENKGRLFCETLLPKDATLTLVGGPGKEFWASGKNWELDENWKQGVIKSMARQGKSPYFGNWRLEVNPGSQNKDDRFLHVLTACDQTVNSAVKSTLIQTESQDGVELVIGDKTVRVMFNRSGELGGEIIITQGGKVVTAGVLSNEVQPQVGVFGLAK